MTALAPPDGEAQATSGLLLRRVRQLAASAATLPDALLSPLPKRAPGSFIITSDGRQALADCDVIVVATSSATPILDADALPGGAILRQALRKHGFSLAGLP